MGIKFGYISPFSYLDRIPESANFHLILAHLLYNKDYVKFYNKKYERGDYIILDNSAFEFKKPIEIEDILKFIKDSGIKISAIVSPDYPFEHSDKTTSALCNFIEKYKKIGLKYNIMAVPQTEEGDFKNLIQSYKLYQSLNDVNIIGISLIAAQRGCSHITKTQNKALNRIFLSNYISNNVGHFLKYHFLGLDQPNELLIQKQIGIIDSCDSSSPIWHGINGVYYDDSMGGLKNGKLQDPVDFEIEKDIDKYKIIDYNIKYMRKIINE